jgi:molybdenum cofactor guanylyltransferase
LKPAVRAALPFGRKEDAAGFVLAGGQSSRMGRDKALVPFAGRPMIAHALSILREASLSASIAGARSGLAEFAPVVPDPESGLGPLAGVCAALSATSAHHAIFLSVDLPFVPPSLLAYLLHHARVTGRVVTMASISGVPQTFPAVVHRAVLPALRAELNSGRSGCFSAFQAAAAGLGQVLSCLPIELLAQTGQVTHPGGLLPYCWFFNLNTAADLSRAEALRFRRIA